MRPYEYLSGWLAHLFLNAIAPENVVPWTRWHSRDGDYRLRPRNDARELLRALLMLYRKGLHRPLHFYPKTAWEYVASQGDIKAAYEAWRTVPYRPFKKEDRRSAAYPLALRGVADPLDQEFIDAANTVFKPLIGGIIDPRIHG